MARANMVIRKKARDIRSVVFELHDVGAARRAYSIAVTYFVNYIFSLLTFLISYMQARSAAQGYCVL
jgi:hypothetical protein